ncbi:bifunctional aspartate kinase/homoserine dehydrogenase II [Thalassotalea atypica]|uniref:bifunctional aspartate kinase/homoserine dehydrogenase II n=1 Tax=Thalassotalea atypica TaxID=2054316 RepID=UPI002572B578|nr:bifunctional aspartate kinase/homoserine dehydrogenase II [Thalassotalea atypica]
MSIQSDIAQIEEQEQEQVWSAMHNKLCKQAVQVHKFGGSSLASVECINRAVDIIQVNCKLDDVVVVSANGDTTDELLHIYELAVVQSDKLHHEISQVKDRQTKLISSLLKTVHAHSLIALLEHDIALLVKWLQVDINAHYSELLALGELWSARLLSAILNERVCPSNAIDARDFLVINNEEQCAVDYDLSQRQLALLREPSKLAVITGFVARNEQGLPCTLGRNGSDYSATILAALTAAQNVTLWTDVDGIYSADPRVVPNARKLHRVPRGVAKELGRLGNPVLHAKTLQPLNDCGSHLHVASSFDANTAGTEIGDFGQIAKQELSVTHLNDLLLAQSVSFLGDVGKQAAKEFSAIGVDVAKGQIVIQQSQQLAVSQWLASHDTEVRFTPVAIIAVVGHNVAQRGNVKVRFKRSLRAQQLIAILTSERQHSFIAVIPQPCTTELLNNVHHDVTKDARHIGLVIAGAGNIGQRFIELLPSQVAKVPALENLHLVGIASSKRILLNTDGLDVESSFEQFEQHSKSYQQDDLLNWLTHHPYDELVVVDITPSKAFSELYQPFFERGIHVIGANKWAASSSTANYNKLLQSAKEHDSLWLGNTTVGAGLPINFAIDDLIASGDEIEEISGIFSGTLSWLFENYDGQQPFDVLLKQALADGITEPDPRDDLSGLDVQRKLLILARLAGFELALEDIDCQNLVPASLQALSVEQFLDNAEQLNDYFEKQLAQAVQQKSCIRYVARFSNTKAGVKAKVSLETLPQTDAFASLTPCDNIFKIVSSWYQDNPLIIRGPGAGRDVTAGGLHSDLVNVCNQLAKKAHQVKLKGINE